MNEVQRVRRWTAEVRRREDVACSVALRRYNNYMGAVDHFNKLLAATMMSMGRCKQRFHRAMFLSWMLPGVGVVNVRTAFGELIRQQFGSEALDAIMSARGVKGNFNRWFQRQLGYLLLRRGTDDGFAANDGSRPHWMPKKTRIPVPRPLLLPSRPGERKWHGDPVNVRNNPRLVVKTWRRDKVTKRSVPRTYYSGRNRCECCKRRAARAAREAGLRLNWNRKASPIKHTPLMCKVCRVYLCKNCWEPWHQVEAPANCREPPVVGRTGRTCGQPSPAPRSSAKRRREQSGERQSALSELGRRAVARMAGSPAARRGAQPAAPRQGRAPLSPSRAATRFEFVSPMRAAKAAKPAAAPAARKKRSRADSGPASDKIAAILADREAKKARSEALAQAARIRNRLSSSSKPAAARGAKRKSSAPPNPEPKKGRKK